MRSLRPILAGSVLPSIDSLISDRPTSWQGMRVDWLASSAPVPIFLGRLTHTAARDRPSAFVFGARYELSDALIEGQLLGEGYFLEYFVVEEVSPSEWSVHRLLQHRSVTFSNIDEPADYLAAQEVMSEDDLHTSSMPRWKKDDAVWPTHDNRPMTFIGQIALPDTKMARDLFTSNVTIFLFGAEWAGSRVFKIVEQETDFQTAQEHYQSEEDGA